MSQKSPTHTGRSGGAASRVGVVVVERVAAIGPQHHGAGLVQHHLRVDDPHQVDHPQVLALVPCAVIVDGAGLLVGHRAGVDLRLGAEPVVGPPQAGFIGGLEAAQAVGPLLQAAGVGQVLEQFVGRAVDVVIHRDVLAEHLVVRVHRPHHLHDDRRGLLARRRLDADNPVDRIGGAVMNGNIVKRGQRHQNGSPSRLGLSKKVAALQHPAGPDPRTLRTAEFRRRNTQR